MYQIGKRKIVGIILVALCLSLLPGGNSQAKKAGVSIAAKAYVVMDANTGEILYNKNATKKLYPASTVKILSSLVVLDHKKLTDRIVYTKAMKKKCAKTGASNLHLRVGTAYQVKDYLHMLLLASDANSAFALAIGVGGSVSKFSKMMKEKAKEIGMKGSSFDNPVGLDKGSGYKKTYGTAKDFTILARVGISNATIRGIVAKSKYRVPKTGKSRAFTVKTTNLFYRGVKYNKKQYQIIGLKTGTTRASGYTFIAVARDSQGREVISTVFGAKSGVARFTMNRKLLDYTFNMANKKAITLSPGFWDTRYCKESEIIRKYADVGILSMPANGKFNPDKNVSITAFVSMMKGIADKAYSAEKIIEIIKKTQEGDISAKSSVRIIDLANVIYDDQEINPGEDEIARCKKKVGVRIKNEEELKRVAALFEAGIVKYGECEDAFQTITRAKMVAIADRMK